MKQKIYVGFFAILLFLGGCGEDEPECLNCAEDWPRLNFIKDVKGIVEFHPKLTNLKIVVIYDEDNNIIDGVNLPICNNDSIYPIGTEFQLSGYFQEHPPEALIFPNPFCYTELEIINTNEPK